MKKVIVLIGFFISFIFPSLVSAQDVQFHINPVVDPEEAYVEIFLSNKGEKSLEFETRTSQMYEITVMNEKGEVVYQYSKGRFFLQAIQRFMLNPGETKTWLEPLKEPRGKSLKPGKYKINVQLKATLVNQNGNGVSGFEDEAFFVVPQENPILQQIKVSKSDSGYNISGKARPMKGILYYVVEDGHHEWVGENKFEVNSKYPTWGDFSFELKIPKEKNEQQIPLILYLYEKDEKGNIIHPYPKLLK